jgi:FKBP-type peptidyl-prolyl cis-trans isomerase
MWPNKKILISLLVACTLVSCEKRTQMPANKFEHTDSTSSEMIRLNQLLVEVEQAEIKAYLDTCSLTFKYTEPGFWMAKTTEGKGKEIRKKDVVLIQYQVETILGKTCYTYTKKLKKQVVVGKVEKQRGFNEALALLKEGDQVSIIIPSNLAYGAMGDTRNIPPRSTLIYRIYTINKIEK